MALSFQSIIFIALTFAVAAPPASGRREEPESVTDLRNFCAQTNRTRECWNIIKPQLDRFNDTNYRGVAGVTIDLAIAKADQIHDLLNRLHEDSKNNNLKDKYLSCSKNYNDAHRNLDLAKRNLDSDNHFRNIPVQIDDTIEELESCRRQFDEDSFDPAHIRNRNKEFGNYVEIVRVATELLTAERLRD